MLNRYEVKRGQPENFFGRLGRVSSERISSWREALRIRGTLIYLFPRNENLVDNIDERTLAAISNPNKADFSPVIPLLKRAQLGYRRVRKEQVLRQIAGGGSNTDEDAKQDEHIKLTSRHGIVEVFVDDALDIARIPFSISDIDRLTRIRGEAIGLDIVLSAALEARPGMERHFSHLIFRGKARTLFDPDGKAKVADEILPERDLQAGETMFFVNGDGIVEQLRVLPMKENRPTPRLILLGQEENADLAEIFSQVTYDRFRVLFLTKFSHWDLTLGAIRERLSEGEESAFRIILRDEARNVISIDGIDPDRPTKFLPPRDNNRIDIVIERRATSIDDFVSDVNVLIANRHPLYQDFVAALGVDVSQTGSSLIKREQSKAEDLLYAPMVEMSFQQRQTLPSLVARVLRRG